ncbi:MAG: M48 family metallopeptidase [Gemmatimonadetes bacterium]|nr:M48 family metallopeptidase [Gemmatimonadota bacterium]
MRLRFALVALTPLLVGLVAHAAMAAGREARIENAPRGGQKTARSGDTRPAAERYFDAEFLRRSEAYNRGKVVYALNARAIRWAAYAMLLLGPLLPAVSKRLTRRFTRSSATRVFFLAWVVLAVTFAAVLPVAFASGYLQEHRYELSHQSLGGWLGDAAKGLGIWGAAFSLLTVLYFQLRQRMPRAGWAALAGVAIVVVVAATFAYPLVVDPLFNRYRPLRDPELRKDLTEMARAEGILLDRILVMEASAKTVRENAYFTGLGRTKRVVLWDNLLENASPAEVRQVFAHELGHWSRGHIVRGLALSIAAIPLLCWFLWTAHGRLARVRRLGLEGPEDPLGIPLLWLLLSVSLFAADPVSNAISRAMEREADGVALELTGDAQTFIDYERRSSVVNLGWVDPPAVWKGLFWTHPTTLERIRMAEEWRSRRAG